MSLDMLLDALVRWVYCYIIVVVFFVLCFLVLQLTGNCLFYGLKYHKKPGALRKGSSPLNYRLIRVIVLQVVGLKCLC